MTKEQLREEFKDFMCKAEVPGRSTNEIINFWLAKFSQARKEAVEGERERIEKWVVENHEHHNFADELPPQGCNGCVDKDYPYVNSMDLVDFIHPHSKDEIINKNK